MAPKVNFLVIGAQKAGTTALDHYLRQHPDIGMADVKEVHYFDDEDVFAHEPTDHAAYEAHFPGTQRLQGETTPIYLWWKPACERIHRYNPEMKLIAVLRDPVDRAFSQWNMEFNRGNETRDFGSAIGAELEQRAMDPGQQHRVFSYLSRGFYSEQIERFQKSFDPHQLLFLNYADLRANPLLCLHRIFDHIGVPTEAYRFAPVEANKGAYATMIDAALHGLLTRAFADDVARTAELTGLNLEEWFDGR